MALGELHILHRRITKTPGIVYTSATLDVARLTGSSDSDHLRRCAIGFNRVSSLVLSAMFMFGVRGCQTRLRRARFCLSHAVQSCGRAFRTFNVVFTCRYCMRFLHGEIPMAGALDLCSFRTGNRAASRCFGQDSRPCLVFILKGSLSNLF